LKTAGLAALWTGHGGVARFVSMTDGSAGHQELAGAKLVHRQHAEAQAGAAAVGADWVAFDNQDGTLMPTLENRYRVIRAVREFQPHVIACPRTNDYHPDHRYTGVTVQDACYMIMVPNIVPNVPVPDREPVVIFMSDPFTKPVPFQPDLVFDLGPVIDKKLDSIMAHTSQLIEWLPWIERTTPDLHRRQSYDEIPTEEGARHDYIRARQAEASAAEADRFRGALVAKYGEARGHSTRYAEGYEVSEYGAPLTEGMSASLFPF
jgi:LmbE family N-acetylglucosaminyl deacetylase